MILIILVLIKNELFQVYPAELQINDDEISVIYKTNNIFNNNIADIIIIKKSEIAAFNVSIEESKNVNVYLETKNGKTINFISDCMPFGLPYYFIINVLDCKNEIPNFNYKEEDISIFLEEHKKNKREILLLNLLFVTLFAVNVFYITNDSDIALYLLILLLVIMLSKKHIDNFVNNPNI
ncbi:hypothetical protein IJ182_02085 [bacterium]|nr:hypothetical protein [bacterium]